jgi:hypothetical protein
MYRLDAWRRSGRDVRMRDRHVTETEMTQALQRALLLATDEVATSARYRPTSTAIVWSASSSPPLRNRKRRRRSSSSSLCSATSSRRRWLGAASSGTRERGNKQRNLTPGRQGCTTPYFYAFRLWPKTQFPGSVGVACGVSVACWSQYLGRPRVGCGRSRADRPDDLDFAAGATSGPGGARGRRAALFCAYHRSEQLPLAANDSEQI